MQKLLFMIINMNVGGTEKALLTMLNEVNREKYEVTLLMLEEYGGFLKDVPTWVKVKYVYEYKDLKKYIDNPPQLLAKELIKSHKYIKGLSLLASYTVSKLTNDMSNYYRYILRNVNNSKEEYDIAVAYAGPMDFITYFVSNKINATKKVQWIHFDITKIGFNNKFASKNYRKFDKIFVVSDEGRDKINNVIPELKSKTETFFNIISPKIISNMSQVGESFSDDFDGFRILTVGRLSKEKGQDLTISVLARLKSEGYKVRWYCVGDGAARKEYEKNIDELGIKEDYVLLGANSNPYSFMKDCDIYVQSSRHEGYCITLAEARCFNNPIVTTNFTGASEQVRDGETGLIAEVNEKDLYIKVKTLLDDGTLRKVMKDNLKNEVVDSTSEIKKLDRLISN